jgi:hypothetical protein
VVATLVALGPRLLDPADTLDRWRGAQDDLPVPERLGALGAEHDLVALVAGAARRVAVDLVEGDDPRRDAAEAARAVRPTNETDAPLRNTRLRMRWFESFAFRSPAISARTGVSRSIGAISVRL